MMDKADAAGGGRLALEYAVGYRRSCAQHIHAFSDGTQPLARTAECLRRNYLAYQCHCHAPLRDAGFKDLYRGCACRRLSVLSML